MHNGFDVLKHVLLGAGLPIDTVKGKAAAGFLTAEADCLFRQGIEAAAIPFSKRLWSEPSHHPTRTTQLAQGLPRLQQAWASSDAEAAGRYVYRVLLRGSAITVPWQSWGGTLSATG